jgi:hypothetical protein
MATTKLANPVLGSVQCEQFARILLKRRKEASTPERARKIERGRNKLKNKFNLASSGYNNAQQEKYF